MDVQTFNKRYEDVPTEYKEVRVLFVTTEDNVGDHCVLEDDILTLVLHVEPTTEAMIEAFEDNYLLPVRA